MSRPIIQVEGLGKRYRLGANRERYLSLRDEMVKRLSPRARKASAARQEFWALKDVSFSVNEGEAVGIIGRNGAGKSTLLKVLSRITPPTEGRITLRGRVASLLEVGTGFHPELTGRENIYLNGAILGMTRREIAAKFDEIVAFAEVEQFLDTPVKRYSSGMYVRLAFAVAAHLEPEILVVDEVLAVGDAEFRRKCLGKMGEVAKSGRTVLFVSHNMAAVQALCCRGVLLRRGMVEADTSAQGAVEAYLQVLNSENTHPLAHRSDRQGNGVVRAVGAWCETEEGVKVGEVHSGQSVRFVLQLEGEDHRVLPHLHVAIPIRGALDEKLFHLCTDSQKGGLQNLELPCTVACTVPSLPLMPGEYRYNVYIAVAGEVTDWVQNAGAFRVVPGAFFESGWMPPNGQGPLLVSHSWAVAKEEGSDARIAACDEGVTMRPEKPASLWTSVA